MNTETSSYNVKKGFYRSRGRKNFNENYSHGARFFQKQRANKKINQFDIKKVQPRTVTSAQLETIGNRKPDINQQIRLLEQSLVPNLNKLQNQEKKQKQSIRKSRGYYKKYKFLQRKKQIMMKLVKILKDIDEDYKRQEYIRSAMASVRQTDYGTFLTIVDAYDILYDIQQEIELLEISITDKEVSKMFAHRLILYMQQHISEKRYKFLKICGIVLKALGLGQIRYSVWLDKVVLLNCQLLKGINLEDYTKSEQTNMTITKSTANDEQSEQYQQQIDKNSQQQSQNSQTQRQLQSKILQAVQYQKQQFSQQPQLVDQYESDKQDTLNKYVAYFNQLTKQSKQNQNAIFNYSKDFQVKDGLNGIYKINEVNEIDEADGKFVIDANNLMNENSESYINAAYDENYANQSQNITQFRQYEQNQQLGRLEHPTQYHQQPQITTKGFYDQLSEQDEGGFKYQIEENSSQEYTDKPKKKKIKNKNKEKRLKSRSKLKATKSKNKDKIKRKNIKDVEEQEQEEKQMQQSQAENQLLQRYIEQISLINPTTNLLTEDEQINKKDITKTYSKGFMAKIAEKMDKIFYQMAGKAIIEQSNNLSLQVGALMQICENQCSFTVNNLSHRIIFPESDQLKKSTKDLIKQKYCYNVGSDQEL